MDDEKFWALLLRDHKSNLSVQILLLLHPQGILAITKTLQQVKADYHSCHLTISEKRQ